MLVIPSLRGSLVAGSSKGSENWIRIIRIFKAIKMITPIRSIRDVDSQTNPNREILRDHLRNVLYNWRGVKLFRWNCSNLEIWRLTTRKRLWLNPGMIGINLATAVNSRVQIEYISEQLHRWLNSGHRVYQPCGSGRGCEVEWSRLKINFWR
jgi:hypothetical protein